MRKEQRQPQDTGHLFTGHSGTISEQGQCKEIQNQNHVICVFPCWQPFWEVCRWQQETVTHVCTAGKNRRSHTTWQISCRATSHGLPLFPSNLSSIWVHILKQAPSHLKGISFQFEVERVYFPRLEGVCPSYEAINWYFDSRDPWLILRINTSGVCSMGRGNIAVIKEEEISLANSVLPQHN